jgi:hypothetical protein
MRRAFDHLLSLALKRMVAVKEIREGLDNRRTLLQAKLDVLQRGNWGFELGTSQLPVYQLCCPSLKGEVRS